MKEITFQKIATFQYSSEALILKGKLESEGIEVFMRDNVTIDTDPLVSNAIGGVKLFVRSEDFGKAQNIVSEISRYSVDDKGEPIKCPKCGAEKTDMVTSISDVKSLVSFVITSFLELFPINAKHTYKCDVCNFEFEKK
ncbi:putative signal transducing protein [Flavobacterium humi]|uniref:DUF2007 domain-containing protein n=1 Tax=Flavobacterium humi TaxID=2562683 RepID=A0A4Z0L726_9FLAO|nr:DUF2007 domain-containing protein [Flavobacterium humi]TGD57579.1 DUF2007 domain-containing protein [Flavobacterium humi]